MSLEKTFDKTNLKHLVVLEPKNFGLENNHYTTLQPLLKITLMEMVEIEKSECSQIK